ncbi:hypothetical protein LOH54_03655 [Sulfurimonas sp. HSL-3221]|uniref:hypothetical protein n=1 Tax=Sulfurimonadaceae TaxID=2771471 RepID=UPI001E2B4EDB|nr:hypothetical protein [Sulfurimonas sp. HSL-3221]UFS63228.1 hypothetical protein LOH54_03655 [Sulfurimonas sp. HSL-3221]
MKKYGIATILGVVLVLFLAYFMHPLDNDSIGLLTLLCVGGSNGIAALFVKSRDVEGIQNDK